MAITLRVVGIFYQTTVDLGTDGGTVKQVLDAAAAAITAGKSFGYSPTTGSPSTFAMYSETGFESPTPDIHMSYPPGYYGQTESFSQGHAPNPYTVWQYYIFDENNVYMNRGAGAISFEDALVPDNGSVIWRLVSVPSGPTNLSGKMALKLGLPVPAV